MGVIELASAGLVIGVLVGMTGMGGGALMTPLLVLVFGVAPGAAVGSDLVVSLVMKPVGALVHHRAGNVRWDLVRWLLPTAVPAAFLGAFLLSLAGDAESVAHVLRWGIGAALIAGVVGMTVQRMLANRRPTIDDEFHPTRIRPVVTLVIGLVGGLVVGVTSVGSGSLIIVMLLLTHPRLSARELVGTDLVQAIPMVGAATMGHLFFGDVRLGLSAALLIGAIPGTYLGARAANRVPGEVVKSILGVVLLSSALALWGLPSVVVLSTVAVASIGLLVGPISRASARRHDRRADQADRPPGRRTARAGVRGVESVP